MSIKSDLLKEIDKKAQKIRDKRIDAVTNSSPESIVFSFFKNIEDSRRLNGNIEYDPTIFRDALESLKKRIKSIDPKATCDIRFQNNTEPWNQDFVQGVTINWSQLHASHQGIETTLYIDISQMLFL